MIETETAAREKGYWQKPENWVAVATLAAVLTYTAFQIIQTRLIWKNNIVSERAFVFVGTPSFNPQIDVSTKKPKSIMFVVPFINSGNTATKDLSFGLRCARSVDTTPEPWVLLNKEGVGFPDIIGPHSAEHSFCEFPIDDFVQISQGRMHGYLLVDMTYRDRIDANVLHRTQAA